MNLKTIRDTIWSTETSAGRWFDLVINCLIIASVIVVTVDTMPSIGASTARTLTVISRVLSVIFVVEYVARLGTSPTPFRYARSFYGVVDLVAILPFLLTVSFDLRAIRVFRLLRLVKLLRAVRFVNAMARIQRAFASVYEEIVLTVVGSTLVLYVAAVGIYLFEKDAQPDIFSSIPASMWWSVCTLSTVGYGDAYPITVGGRVFASAILVLGVGIVALPSALLAAALTGDRAKTNLPDN